jgi:shikimate kinase/SAM-dependent methyltransferase
MAASAPIRHIVVVGLMGVGKTTIGRGLAARTGWRLRDSDAEIEAATGTTVRELRDRNGVAPMHELEARQLLDALADPEPSVIDAAASTIESPACRTALGSAGVLVVWLRASPVVLAARFASSDHRPAYGADPADFLAEQARRRDPLFESLDPVVIDEDGRDPEAVLRAVLAAVSASLPAEVATKAQGAGPTGDDEREPARSRREMWDERHAARQPIESRDPDPTLVEACATLRPGRALDLGTGDGRNAVWLAARGWQVTAVDFSSVALDRGRTVASAAGVEVDWRLLDLTDWAPPKASFDLVALFFIHLPVAERRIVHANAAAAVAPGGTLLVVGHDRSNLTDGVGGPQDPRVLFTPAEVVAGLPDGFAVERAETVRRAGTGERGPLDAVVLARRLPLSGG